MNNSINYDIQYNKNKEIKNLEKRNQSLINYKSIHKGTF